MAPFSATVAGQTRLVADRICQLPQEVVASFACGDRQGRMIRLQAVTADISAQMFPVVDWLERRRPNDKAEMVKARLYHALNEAVRCAGLEIPEYAGGTITPSVAEPSDGAHRTATLFVFTRKFAEALRGWADDIEEEETQRAQPAQVSKQGKDEHSREKPRTNRSDADEKLIAALTKHHKYADGGCLNLTPIGSNELARLAGVSGSTAFTFFKDEFDGYAKYKALCADSGGLIAALKLLNGEYSPSTLYGRRPPEDGDRDDE